MITPGSKDLRGAFIALVRDWFTLLSQGEVEAAAAMIDAENSYGVRWGAQEIQAALREYSRDGETPKVTNPSSVAGEGRSDFGAFDDGGGYWLDYAVPLDGEWSDLTAQFEFHVQGDRFAFVLHDMHVL